MSKNKMEVTLVGRGSDDVIKDRMSTADIPKYTETNKVINSPDRRKASTDSVKTNNTESGYNDESYIRFIFDSINRSVISADTGANLTVLRILKILDANRVTDIPTTSAKIIDTCIQKLVDIYFAHFSDVINNNSLSTELLVAADVVIRELCDSFGVTDTTRIQKFQKLIEELF